MSNARPTNRLAAANAKAAAAETQQGRLRAAISGARVFEPFTIPRLGLGVLVTLCPYDEAERIEGDVYERMRARKLELSTSTENTYELVRARLTLAVTFLDPETKEPIGSAEDWGGVDEDIIGECWRFQSQVRAKYDPINRPVSQEEIDLVALAVKKKDLTFLRFLGTRMLASYLLATAEQASPSPTPTSSPGESPSESRP